MRLVLLSALFWFALDQISKWWVMYRLNLLELVRIEVFPPFLNFHMGWNTGINFGLLANDANAARWLLIAIAFGVSAWILYWAKTGLTRPVALISAGAIVGGAMANAADRIVYGAVADFLNMSCCGFHNPFAFNLADVGIFAGAIGLLIFADARKMTP